MSGNVADTSKSSGPVNPRSDSRTPRYSPRPSRYWVFRSLWSWSVRVGPWPGRAGGSRRRPGSRVAGPGQSVGQPGAGPGRVAEGAVDRRGRRSARAVRGTTTGAGTMARTNRPGSGRLDGHLPGGDPGRLVAGQADLRRSRPPAGCASTCPSKTYTSVAPVGETDDAELGAEVDHLALRARGPRTRPPPDGTRAVSLPWWSRALRAGDAVRAGPALRGRPGRRTGSGPRPARGRCASARPGRRSPGGSPSAQVQFWAFTSHATASSASGRGPKTATRARRRASNRRGDGDAAGRPPQRRDSARRGPAQGRRVVQVPVDGVEDPLAGLSGAEFEAAGRCAAGRTGRTPAGPRGRPAGGPPGPRSPGSSRCPVQVVLDQRHRAARRSGSASVIGSLRRLGRSGPESG